MPEKDGCETRWLCRCAYSSSDLRESKVDCATARYPRGRHEFANASAWMDKVCHQSVDDGRDGGETGGKRWRNPDKGLESPDEKSPGYDV